MRLGHVIDLKGRKIVDLTPHEYYNEIISKLWNYGVICIKEQDNLELTDFVSIVNRAGPAVRLPAQLAFNNLQNDFPEIARVGNITSNGTLVEKHTAAEYWHTDGEFWPAPQNFVVNWLLASIVPEKGGATGFMDMQQIYSNLSDAEKNKFKNSKFEIDVNNIDDFKGVDAKKMNFKEITHHKIESVHPFTKKTSLYLGGGYSEIMFENGKKEKADSYIKDYSEKYPFYTHNWKKGDLLIFDNTQVMHRGLGGYGNFPRLLYRAQNRVTPFFINLIKKFII